MSSILLPICIKSIVSRLPRFLRILRRCPMSEIGFVAELKITNMDPEGVFYVSPGWSYARNEHCVTLGFINILPPEKTPKGVVLYLLQKDSKRRSRQRYCHEFSLRNPILDKSVNNRLLSNPRHIFHQSEVHEVLFFPGLRHARSSHSSTLG